MLTVTYVLFCAIINRAVRVEIRNRRETDDKSGEDQYRSKEEGLLLKVT